MPIEINEHILITKEEYDFINMHPTWFIQAAVVHHRIGSSSEYSIICPEYAEFKQNKLMRLLFHDRV